MSMLMGEGINQQGDADETDAKKRVNNSDRIQAL